MDEPPPSLSPTKIARRLLLAAVLAGLWITAYAYGEAIAEPVVRRAQVKLAGWPAGAAPVTALFISDVHVGGPDMPPERLARIVAQINRLRPDVVLIAGDLISDKRAATHHYTMAEALAPLAGLRPRLGTVAVLGNHDYWHDAPAARAGLAKAGVKLLHNEGLAIGPLAIGGLDDDFTRHADLPATLERMRPIRGSRLLLSHSPDPFAALDADVGLMLAGHTHCGQIAPPPFGAIYTMSRYGKRFACGVISERGRTLIVTAGLGTSGLPLRLGAPPEMWLLELGG